MPPMFLQETLLSTAPLWRVLIAVALHRQKLDAEEASQRLTGFDVNTLRHTLLRLIATKSDVQRSRHTQTTFGQLLPSACHNDAGQRCISSLHCTTFVRLTTHFDRW